MPQTLSAEFDTRRDAEMTVEHLVQEYGLDRSAISIVSMSEDNSAGTQVAGADLEQSRSEGGSETHPALSGRLKVSVQAGEDHKDKILETFSSFGGKPT